MRNLAQLQTAMTRAVFSGNATPLTGEISAPTADALRRFNIYRNNMFLSLARHLKIVFPVTARLSDERFFSYAAHEFIKFHPPREPRLSAYGSEFPRFLGKFPACRTAPILPAMASLEWAIQTALTTPEERALSPAGLAGMSQPSLRLLLQPSLQFVLSRWPLLPLIQGTHAEGVPLQRRTTYTAVRRAGDSIRFMELGCARYIFWRSLSRGTQLDHAAARALARDPIFNLVDEMLNLFRANLVTAIDNSHAQMKESISRL
jgi:hypothetical protein